MSVCLSGIRRAGFAVAQCPPQLRGLHRNSKKIITQGNIKILLQSIKVNIDILSYYYIVSASKLWHLRVGRGL